MTTIDEETGLVTTTSGRGELTFHVGAIASVLRGHRSIGATATGMRFAELRLGDGSATEVTHEEADQVLALMRAFHRTHIVAYKHAEAAWEEHATASAEPAKAEI